MIRFPFSSKYRETSSADKYILALQFAEEHETFTLQEIKDNLALTEQQELLFATQIHNNQIFFQNHSNYINNPNYRELVLQFSVDDKFRLLEFIALDEARQSSNEAKRFAVVALFVSILTGVGSIFMANRQIDSDVNLPHKVLEDFSKVKGDISESKILLQDIKRLNDKGASHAISVEKK